MLIRHTIYVDLRLVSYFLEVVERGSVSAAAKALHVGQPSLSRQISKLEREMGVTLFTRGIRTTPTAAGIAFTPIARDLITRAQQAETTIRSLKKDEFIRLTIAGPPTTVADVIAPFIASAGAKGLLSNIRESLPNVVYNELSSGRADVVIGTGPPPAHTKYVVIGSAPIFAQVPEDHSLANESEISLAELSSNLIAVVDDAHYVRRIFDDAMAQEGLASNIAFETQSSHASQALAAAHRAVCISSDDPRFGLRPLLIRTKSKAKPLSITLFAVWDGTHYAESLIAATAIELQRFYSQLLPD
jgi:DNA-binding transcriptional LysR family regulator